MTSLVSGKQPPSNKRRTFGEKNLVSFGTFPYALCNLTFTNKLLVNGQDIHIYIYIKLVSLKKFFILYFC